MHYAPNKKTKGFETLLKELAYDKFPEQMLGPVSMTITFIFPRPSVMVWKKKPMNREWRPKGKDIDNLIKTICDGLNGVAYIDDRQVVEVIARKCICINPQEKPRTVINIEPAPNIELIKGVWD